MMKRLDRHLQENKIFQDIENNRSVVAQELGKTRKLRSELPLKFRLPRVMYNRRHHERGDDEDTEAAIHI